MRCPRLLGQYDAVDFAKAGRVDISSRMLKAVQEQITIVSRNTESDWVIPLLTRCRTSAAAATLRAEPRLVSFENYPRSIPCAIAAPIPPEKATSRPNALRKICASTAGTSVRCVPITKRAVAI